MLLRKAPPVSVNPALAILCESYSRNIFPLIFETRLTQKDAFLIAVKASPENREDDLILIRGTSNFYVNWNEARIKAQLPKEYHYLITKFSSTVDKGLIAWGSVVKRV